MCFMPTALVLWSVTLWVRIKYFHYASKSEHYLRVSYVPATNGVIHIIEKVLVPTTAVTLSKAVSDRWANTKNNKSLDDTMKWIG